MSLSWQASDVHFQLGHEIKSGMSLSLADIQNLVDTRAAETPSLEFKAGSALSRGGRNEDELIKDVSAMANAAGGTIIYGIAEGQAPNGESVAASVEPVTDPATTTDWIHQLIAANTSPPLGAFRVTSIACPAPHDNGRIVIINVDMAGTAHQSTRSHRYFQRIGTAAKPMLDFQIRDVMARRSKPRIVVRLGARIMGHSDVGVQLDIRPSMFNEGSLSIDRWLLRIGVPQGTVDATRMGHQVNTPPVAEDRSERFRGFHCLDYASTGPHIQAHRMNDLHPGCVLDLDGRMGFGVIKLLITDRKRDELEARQNPIRWTLFIADTQPQDGEIPFTSWCNV